MSSLSNTGEAYIPTPYIPSESDMAEFFLVSRGIESDLSALPTAAVSAAVVTEPVYRGECRLVQLRLGDVAFTLRIDQFAAMVQGVAGSDRDVGYELLSALEGALTVPVEIGGAS